MIPTLDDATKKAVNELTIDEVLPEKIPGDFNASYYDFIVHYGVSALAHFHLMKKAEEINSGKMSIEEFIDKYNIKFSAVPYIYSFEGTPFVEDSGIFVPAHPIPELGASTPQRRIAFFDRDLFNVTRYRNFPEETYGYAWKLAKRVWQQPDLADKRLVADGARFGKDMLLECAAGWNQNKNGGRDQKPLSPKLLDLGNRLMDYYLVLVSE